MLCVLGHEVDVFGNASKFASFNVLMYHVGLIKNSESQSLDCSGPPRSPPSCEVDETGTGISSCLMIGALPSIDGES